MIKKKHLHQILRVKYFCNSYHPELQRTQFTIGEDKLFLFPFLFLFSFNFKSNPLLFMTWNLFLSKTCFRFEIKFLYGLCRSQFCKISGICIVTIAICVSLCQRHTRMKRKLNNFLQWIIKNKKQSWWWLWIAPWHEFFCLLLLIQWAGISVAAVTSQ